MTFLEEAEHEDLLPIRLLLLDFDGVLTDNRVHVHQDGTESVTCHRGDGWGIARLGEVGVEVQVISTEVNSVVSVRCTKLGIECHQAITDKRGAVEAILAERDYGPDRVAFVGNDVNDLPAFAAVGVAIAVGDAVHEVQRASKWVTRARGGHGAVREVCDAIMAARWAL